MLDQNTDRMWYVIGAIVIGAAIIAMGLNIFSDSFDSVDGMMASLTNLAGENVASVNVDPLIADGYIPIATADELNSIRENTTQTFGLGTKWESEYESGLDKNYVQVADIDLSEFDNWVPIGGIDSESSFQGVYDGSGYTISDLVINGGSMNYVGLFSRADGAEFKNLNLLDFNVRGGTHVGGLVGRIDKTSIKDTSINGDIFGTSLVGGLVGRQDRSEMMNCKAQGTMSVHGHYVGGLAGSQNASQITASHVLADIYGTGSYVGGIVGNQNGEYYFGTKDTYIKDTYFIGEVIGVDHVGGLTGLQTKAVTLNSYTLGNIDGSSYVGGLIGSQIVSSSIINSYTGSIVNGDVGVGGLLGDQTISSVVVDSFYDRELSGQSDIGRGIGKSTTEMQQQSTYEGWDFNSIWQMSDGQYPTLR